jgi:predicted esterase
LLVPRSAKIVAARNAACQELTRSMSSSSPRGRVLARAAFVCLASALSLTSVVISHAAAAATVSAAPEAAIARLSARTLDRGPVTLEPTTRGVVDSAPAKLAPKVLGFAPAQSAPVSSTTVIYLHGVHGRAERGCPWLRDGASEVGWLVCPTGVVEDEGGAGTASWGGDVPAQGAVVARALRAAEDAGGSSEPAVAVGFSQGSYVALDLVKTGLARFRGLVLLAAPDAHPSAAKLKAAGVVRIALASGSLDAAYEPLARDVDRLRSEGIEARFFDLGPVGHTYAAANPEALRDAITWAAGR